MLEIEIHKSPDLVEEIRQKPGQLVRQVMIETAHEIGGEDFADEVTAKFTSEELLPDYNALQHLESKRPGITGQIIDRAGHLEQVDTNKCSIRKLGRALIKFVDSIK